MSVKFVERGSKKFKIIPEIKVVEGRMDEKHFDDDLKFGITPRIKELVYCAAKYYRTKPKKRNNKIEDPYITGYAYCDEYDEFDEKVGIDVCAAKMELKNHLKLAKKYRKASDDLVEASHVADDLAIKHETKAMAIESDLVRYYGRLSL